MPPLKVAAVQTSSKLGDPDHNLAAVQRLTRTAAAQGAHLIVFPECMNSGYVWDDPAHALTCADPIPGRFTTALAELAAALGVYVAIGLAEREDDKVYNSAALIGPTGLIGKYQKNFLFDFDPYWFSGGRTGYPVYDTPLGKIGMFICADARIPEGARALTLNGAEILLHITNSTTHEQHEMHVPTRGNENEAWIISADKAGRERGLTYPGNTLIVGPDGAVRAQGSFEKEEILYADVDVDLVRQIRGQPDGLLRGRRPDTYATLTWPYASLPFAKVADTPVIPSALTVLASALQVCNTDGDARAALQRAVTVGYEAAKENARLIVFPELFLCSSAPTPEAARATADLVGETLTAFGRIARQWSATYVLDLVERDGARYHHTAFVVGPDGDVLGRYRKVHLTPAERAWATAGDDYLVLELPFGNVGVMLGHEVCFFEVARVLTCRGADVIAAPSAWRAMREERLFLRERALENKVFIVAGNRTDAGVPGRSRIVLPNASVMSQSTDGQADYTFGFLNLAWARDKQIRPGTDLIRNRRPEFYGRFVEPWMLD